MNEVVALSDLPPKGEPTTLWTMEVDRPLPIADVDLLTSELGIDFHHLDVPYEFVVGQRFLKPDDHLFDAGWRAGLGMQFGVSLLRVTRRSAPLPLPGSLRRLPGLALRLESDIAGDTAEQYEELRLECATLLGKVGIAPHSDDVGYWFEGIAR